MRIIDLRGRRVLDERDHNESLNWIENTPDPVLALGRLYPAGFQVPPHSHNRVQLWFARRGVVLVSTEDGRWMIPPGHALVIPAGLTHATEMVSDVEMHSIYVEPAEGQGEGRPRVVEVTPLARSLIGELVALDIRPLTLRRQKLVMDLLLDEVWQLPERPLGLPFPAEARLARLCRQFLESPAAQAGIDHWAEELSMSRRSFTRFFRAETGVSFGTWRQQACIFASLPRLSSGEPVTAVALDAGYENIAAFTTMFRRMLGTAPSQWARSRVG